MKYIHVVPIITNTVNNAVKSVKYVCIPLIVEIKWHAKQVNLQNEQFLPFVWFEPMLFRFESSRLFPIDHKIWLLTMCKSIGIISLEK